MPSFPLLMWLQELKANEGTAWKMTGKRTSSVCIGCCCCRLIGSLWGWQCSRLARFGSCYWRRIRFVLREVGLRRNEGRCRPDALVEMPLCRGTAFPVGVEQ